MRPLIRTHRDEPLAMAHKRRLTIVRVFGSMTLSEANGTSDLDLLLTLAPGVGGLALCGFLLAAQELLGRRVDVVTEAGLHPALRVCVLASAVPL